MEVTNTRAPASVAPRIARFIDVSCLHQFWRRHISALPARRPCCEIPQRAGSRRKSSASSNVVPPLSPSSAHLKEHRMGRNYLANASRDAINAVLAAAGYNFSLKLPLNCFIRCGHVLLTTEKIRALGDNIRGKKDRDIDLRAQRREHVA